jgi:acyl-CoA synthetase (AMP-forming)/AMP-acid ligase II
MLAAADRSGLDFTSLRLCLATGPAMPADMLHRFEDRFGCIVREEYRLSEISPVAGLSDPSEVRKVRSLGRPIDGVELRVVDDQGGEVPVGRCRGASDPRPQRDEGLLQPARGHKDRLGRGLVGDRRHRNSR